MPGKVEELPIEVHAVHADFIGVSGDGVGGHLPGTQRVEVLRVRVLRGLREDTLARRSIKHSEEVVVGTGEQVTVKRREAVSISDIDSIGSEFT